MNVYDEIGDGFVGKYALFEDDIRSEVRFDAFEPIHESRIVTASKFLSYRIRLALSNSRSTVDCTDDGTGIVDARCRDV